MVHLDIKEWSMIFFLWQIFNWLWTWTMPWERWLWSSVPGQKQIRWLSICHQKDPFTQLVMITVLLTILDDELLLKVEFSALCIDPNFCSDLNNSDIQVLAAKLSKRVRQQIVAVTTGSPVTNNRKTMYSISITVAMYCLSPPTTLCPTIFR